MDTVEWAERYRECLLECIGENIDREKYVKLARALTVSVILRMMTTGVAGLATAMIPFLIELGIDGYQASNCPAKCVEMLASEDE